MKWIVFAACCAVFVTSPAHAQDAAPALQEEGDVVLGQRFTLDSAVLGETRNIAVRLPRGYDEAGTAYPVLYVIDGGAEQDFLQIAGMSDLSWLSGQFADMIVVGIETVDRQHELTYPSSRRDHRRNWPTHGASADFRRYVTSEVIPAIEAAYRTNDQRVVMGESLAGLVIVETALETPDAFTGYIAVSPSLWWDNASLSRRADEALAGDYPAGRTFYLTMADEGPQTEAATGRVVAALDQYDDAHSITWWYEPLPDESHSTIYHRAALTALRRLFPPPAEDD